MKRNLDLDLVSVLRVKFQKTMLDPEDRSLESKKLPPESAALIGCFNVDFAQLQAGCLSYFSCSIVDVGISFYLCCHCLCKSR